MGGGFEGREYCLNTEGEVGGDKEELGGFLYEMLRKERFFIEACKYTYLEVT